MQEAKDELWTTALTMLLSVLEGVEEPDWPRRMYRSLKFTRIKCLLDDVWARRDQDQALELGFMAMILIRTLIPYQTPGEAPDPRLGSSHTLQEWLEKCAGYTFYTALTGRIEILRASTGNANPSLVRVYFRVPFICSNLSDKTKQELLWNVRRDTPTARIADFFQRAEELIFEIEYYEKHFKIAVPRNDDGWFPLQGEYVRRLKFWINESIHIWERGMILLAFVINALVCYSYVTHRDGETGPLRQPLVGYRPRSTAIFVTTNILMLLQTGICACLLMDFWWSKAPLHAHRRQKKEMAEYKKKRAQIYSMKRMITVFESSNHNPGSDWTGTSSPRSAGHPTLAPVQPGAGGRSGAVHDPMSTVVDEKLPWGMEETDSERNIPEYTASYTFIAVYKDMNFVYFTACILFAVCGLLISHFFCWGHLIGLIHRSASLQNVIKAVTKNGKQILMTAVMMVIVVYIFSVVAFVYFRESFHNDDETDADDYHCDSLSRCFVYGVTAGLRQGGGLADIMQPLSWDEPYATLRIVFDTFFFAFVIIVLLNIVFGIIIDTFADLRTGKKRIEEDMRNRCFICGIESAQFDRQADGFESHIKNDHYMWNYVFFIHHLRRKSPDEYTGQESYVHSMMEKGDLSFFPSNNALVLQGKQEEDDQSAELMRIHEQTESEVKILEDKVAAFDSQFRREHQELRSYLDSTWGKVETATAKRHSIMSGLEAAPLARTGGEKQDEAARR